jgi:hypothetical protein
MPSVKNKCVGYMTVTDRGNGGKTIEVSAQACWRIQRGFKFQGVDWDGKNQSFSRTFPDHVKLQPVMGHSDHDVIFSSLKMAAQSEVPCLFDIQAHIGAEIIQVIEKTHFLDYADERGFRLVVGLIPGDDMEIMENVARVVGKFGNRVGYQIIHNKYKFPRLKMFRGSPLEATLLNEYDAQTLVIPVLYDSVRLRWMEAEARHNRGISIAEFAMNADLGVDSMTRAVAEEWLRDMYRQYDRMAPLLLTAAELETFQPPPPSAQTSELTRRRGAGFNFGE